MNLREIVHELIEHSTLGQGRKDELHGHLDAPEPVEPVAEPDTPAETKTPEGA